MLDGRLKDKEALFDLSRVLGYCAEERILGSLNKSWGWKPVVTACGRHLMQEAHKLETSLSYQVISTVKNHKVLSYKAL